MASANVVHLTTDNWEQEVVKSDKPVLVDFWAVWCAPCRALGPTIEKVATQFSGKIKVGKLDVDEAQEIAIRYGISSLPTVMVFKGDSAAEQTVGAQHESVYVKMLNRVLEK